MRALVILRGLVPLVLSVLRDRRRWLVAGGPVPRTEAFHERRAARVVATLAALGPTFVKMGQVFAGRADLLPVTYVNALATLTDRVPPVPVEQVERTIVESYGRPAAELFERFDREPLAAASLGQVHRARYAGEEVVIKVLRPGVETLVAEDVRVSLRLIEIVERWVTNPHVRALRTVIEQFALHVPEEMDFRQEAANAEAIRANFAGNRGVAIPRIVAGLVRQRTLVMQYMEGAKIDRVPPDMTGGDGAAVVRRVMELYMQMMLVDGLFHADPHPGNLLVAPDGTVVLLDFGMVVRVPVETRRALVATAFAGIKRDRERVVDGFYTLGVALPTADRARISALVELLFVVTDSHGTAPERVQLLADEVMANLYDFPVELPGEMVYFARTAALIEGIGVRYDERFNAALFATPVALRMRGRILASLNGGTQPEPDLPSLIGGIVGDVLGVAARAGRELAALVSERLAGGALGLDSSGGGRPGQSPLQGWLTGGRDAVAALAGETVSPATPRLSSGTVVPDPHIRPI